MVRNYLSTAWRNIRQNPLFSLINMASLAVGLASCLVIYLFIADEQSFDGFHSRNQNIYRLDEIQNFSGTNVQKVALSMPPMAPNMKADFPEIRSYARFHNRDKRLIKRGEDQFLVRNVASADSTFLEIFDFKMLEGDRLTALDQPWMIVLTRETALKFFKDPTEAMGRSLTISEREYTISGVLEDVPENSHLQFSALVSMATDMVQDKNFNTNWGSNYVNTYLVLADGADIKGLERKFPEFMLRHTGNKDINNYYTLFLQPLNQVHLGSTDIEHDYNNYRKFNGSYLDVFAVIGAFILLIASVNFMNLTTARASHRWKEIGVRSAVGAGKGQLFWQFIFESMLLSLFAMVFAVLLDMLFIPLLNQLIGRQLSLLSLVTSPWAVGAMVAASILLGLLAGVYPSLYMTSFRMNTILRGGAKAGRNPVFRNALVVIQFGLALAMIVSTLIVLQQIKYMQTKNIGFIKDQMVLIDMNREVNDKFITLKEELLKSRYVQGVTASGQRLGNNFHQWGFKVKGDTGIIDITPSNVNVEFDYLKVYGIKLKEGRSFSRENKMDAGYAFIINEAFAKELALKEAVGTRAGHDWYKNDSLGTIIGVAEDFNFNSLHYKINGLSMVVHPDWGYDEMSVKIDGNNVEKALADIRETWGKTVSFPFNYTFLDEHFNNLYRSDEQMSAVVTIMASLAIILSCMGLFGLVTITTTTRIKEIGIRKTLGATEFQIGALLLRSFMVLILASFVLSSPVTYWMLSGWLESFAYRVTISPLLFLAGGLVALVIALLTISYRTIKSARANPVDALRYE